MGNTWWVVSSLHNNYWNDFGWLLEDWKNKVYYQTKKSINLLEYDDQLGQGIIDAATIIEESGKKKTHSGIEFYINTNKFGNIFVLWEYWNKKAHKDAILAINWYFFGVEQ